jgi:maltose alpha-D-glucosyltransferase / alpha-amylase
MTAPQSAKETGALLRERLPAVLPDYLKKQRWFGGKARRILRADIADTILLRSEDAEVAIVFAAVQYDEGPAEINVLPLRMAWDPGTATQASGFALKISDGRGQDVVLEDAFEEPDFPRELLDAIAQTRVLAGGTSEIQARPTEALAQVCGDPGSLPARRIRGEQSNSSVIYGDRLILKFFRRLEPGVNPDLELGLFLTERAHFAHIPRVVGRLQYRCSDGTVMTQGILQEFVPNEGDAWRYTVAVTEECYRRAAEMFDAGETGELAGKPAGTRGYARLPGPVEELLVSYIEKVKLLARRTAEMHLALASDSADPDFAPEPYSVFYQRECERSTRELTDRVFRQLRHKLSDLTAPLQAAAERCLAFEPEIERRFHRTLNEPIGAMRTRIHGDYHLGQVLYTGSDFVIIDFEGEPARPLAERRTKRSPLQDVAGMLRSFHYAAFAPLLGSAKGGSYDTTRERWAAPLAEAWYVRVRDQFLDTYLEVAGSAPFVPASRPEIDALLEIHLLEKAVYELGYELNNRPDWLEIPMAGIARVLNA